MLVFGTVHNDNLVRSISNSGFHSLVGVGADDHANQLAALNGGKLAAGIEQFKANISGLSGFFGLNKDPEILIFGFHFKFLLPLRSRWLR
ncbi:hypothetical protein SDC9_209745 [bioreactor metagenome]|uniref:Uncharacterized protein n=1 Tax=bioreactor metagenome TaxID=1076179 RepID=A0A645JH30_9ZZZZ